MPDITTLTGVGPVAGADFVVWDMRRPPPTDLVMAVVPYQAPMSVLGSLRGSTVSFVQGQYIGYDGVSGALPPGITFCNAAGVHETSTAELALTLTLASLRGIPRFVGAQLEGRWAHAEYDSLADKRVLIIGQGGVGRAAATRFRPFEVELIRVATTARADEDGYIHGAAELGDILPQVDVVVLAVPLTEATTGLVGDTFLRRLKPGALIVNVSRGAVVDTEALIVHAGAGRVRAALDVTVPEPLPPEHQLWRTPGILISPHVGAHSGAMAPRFNRLIRRQATRLVGGEPPLNVVLQT